MKSTELHPTTVRLAAVRWGSFDLRFDGVNTAGTWARCTVRLEWQLWPLIVTAVAAAFLGEKRMRLAEISAIEQWMPSPMAWTESEVVE